MKKRDLFFLNALILSAVSITVRLVGVSFNAYISKKVGAECMGLFTLVTSVYGLAVIFATSGINLAVVRLVTDRIATDDFSKGDIKRIVRSSVIYAALFGITAGVTVFFASGFIGEKLLGDARTVLSLKVFAFSLPAISVSSALSGYFTAVRRVYKSAITSLAEQGAKVVLITAGLVTVAPKGIEYACVAIVGGGALAEGMSLLLHYIFYKTDRYMRRGGCPVQSEKNGISLCMKDVLNLALPVAVGTYARQGLITAEHLAIPKGLKKYGMNSSDALSSYGIMCGMVFPLVLFPSAVLYAFAGLLIPELSECNALGDRERILNIERKVFRSSFLFSVCVAGIFISFSDVIGMKVYNSTEASRQLFLIAPLIPVMYLDSVVDGMLKGLGEQVYCMKVNLFDSVLCLMLVLVLVPKFGIDGYIFLTIISEIINAALSVLRLLKITGMRVRYYQWIVAPVLSVIASTCAVKILTTYCIAMPMWMMITACSILYIAFCFLFGSIGHDDISKLKMLHQINNND